MLTEERHQVIRDRLNSDGRVIANDLAKEFDVSEDTVRRDLRELAKAGHCRRVYGGALAPAPNLGSITQRSTTSTDEKERLAKCVAGIILPGQTIFIDAGSTNIAIARALQREMALTVVTNAPAVALALSDHDKCRTILLGGVLNQDKGACLGGQTLNEVRRIYADVFVLGTCGVDASVGVTALDVEEAELKRTMVEQSGQLLVPATADKIGTIAHYSVAVASAIDTLISSIADEDRLAPFRELGAKVHIAA